MAIGYFVGKQSGQTIPMAFGAIAGWIIGILAGHAIIRGDPIESVGDGTIAGELVRMASAMSMSILGAALGLVVGRARRKDRSKPTSKRGRPYFTTRARKGETRTGNTISDACISKVTL